MSVHAAKPPSTSSCVTDVVTLAQNLVRCPSVTPEDAGAQAYLSGVLKKLGFECQNLPFGNVPNLFARLGTGHPHICFAGHTDVVPPGPENLWTHPPFEGVIKDRKLYGRGASDMKGGVAAFTAAIAAYLQEHGKPAKGSISLLITGDEEGVAVDGTVKVLQWMKDHGHVPDAAIVGEPTNPDELGQEIKVGRRGSMSCEIHVRGRQGHAAYPRLADNPLPRLVKLLGALTAHEFDKGSEFFQATNLEITSIDVGNPAKNVIPAAGRADFNIRFSDLWTNASIEKKIREILDSVKAPYELKITSGNAESFLSTPGPLAELVKQAVKHVTGRTPALTTNGGTSDARFIQKYCPVVEVGAINATVHQVDEHARIDHLEGTMKIYKKILELWFA
ncbi:MAG: succinyl-diaminopimelate desuccinylase [Alphaproteobacteria bacterium]